MIKGLESQRWNHYLAEALKRVARGRMRPQEVDLLKESIPKDEEDEKQALKQAVRSRWPVDIIERRRIQSLVHILVNVADKHAAIFPQLKQDSEPVITKAQTRNHLPMISETKPRPCLSS